MFKTGKGDQVKSSMKVNGGDDNEDLSSIERIYFDEEYKLSIFLIQEENIADLLQLAISLHFKLYECPNPSYKLFVNNMGNVDHTIAKLILLHSQRCIKKFPNKYPHLERILKTILQLENSNKTDDDDDYVSQQQQQRYKNI